MKSIVPWVLLLLLVVCDAACVGPREDEMPTPAEETKVKRSLLDTIQNFMSPPKTSVDSPLFVIFTPLGYIFDPDFRDSIKQKLLKF